jgi:hypothetical protein
MLTPKVRSAYTFAIRKCFLQESDLSMRDTGVKGLLDRTADLSKPPKRKYTKSSEKAKMKISSDPSREDSYFVGGESWML